MMPGPGTGTGGGVAGERGAQGRAAKPGPPGRSARQGRCGDRGDPPGTRGDGLVPRSMGGRGARPDRAQLRFRVRPVARPLSRRPSVSASSTMRSSATTPGRRPSATTREGCAHRPRARSVCSPKPRGSTRETSIPTATSRRKASSPATTSPGCRSPPTCRAGRWRKGRDEFISRPRFLAISEFGPRALIYHEGARYRVYKVNLDFASDAAEDTHRLATDTMKRCPGCGYAHLQAGETNLAEVCDRCGAALDTPSRIDGLVRLQNVSLSLAQRITCDEEERQRFGYHLVTAYRFPRSTAGSTARMRRFTATTCARSRSATVTPPISIASTSGWTHQDGNQPRGFNLDLERGYWSRNQADAEDRDDAAAEGRIARVVPFVRDTRNALVMRFRAAARRSRNGESASGLQAGDPAAFPT